jgi:hypothetical protein
MHARKQAANCRLDLILRKTPRKGSAAFLLGKEVLPKSTLPKPIRGRRVHPNPNLDSPYPIG